MAGTFSRLWASFKAHITRSGLFQLSPRSTPGAATSTLGIGGTWNAQREYFSPTFERYYRTQPFVRTCIDFLARNVAQLPLHVYRRHDDDSRERLREHPLAKLLAHPNADTDDTYFDLMVDTMTDFLIYGHAFWLKVRDPNRFERLSLWRVPPKEVRMEGFLRVDRFVIRIAEEETRFNPNDVVHFATYEGLSTLESLRPFLDEESAAAKYRFWYWSNSARPSGIVERPKDAGRWTPEQRDEWLAYWREFYQGTANQGKTAVLEDGMSYRQLSYSAEESQLDEARRFVRDAIAAAFMIPPPMVGILDNATYSNIREQHRMLYQDCLGPTLAMFEQRIEADLLTEFKDRDGIYCEFNIAEKLQGSFEEQAQALQALTGGTGVLTVNEARARLNLPRIDDERYDLPAVPLNIQLGEPEELPVPFRAVKQLPPPSVRSIERAS